MDDDENDNEKQSREEPDSIKGSVALILNAALLPSATRIGKELDSRLKDFFETAREGRRKENLRIHVERIAPRLEEGEQPKQTVEHLNMLESWAEAAQDVDPDSGDFADMWQELLVSLAQGRCSERSVLETMKKLEPHDAALLLEAHHNGYCVDKDGRDRFHLRKMKTFGLVNEDRTQQEMILKLAAMTLGVGALLSVIGGFGSGSKPGTGREFSLPAFSFSAIIPASVAMVVLMLTILALMYYFRSSIRRMVKWKLTWLGTELMRNTTNSVSKL